MYCVARPINGISLNGDEYLCDEDGEIMEFGTPSEAESYLREAGMTEEEIENDVIIREKGNQNE